MASLYICLGGLRVFDPDLQLLSMHGVEKNARMQEVCLQCMHRNFLDIDHECMQFVLCPSLQVWRLDGATQERLDRILFLEKLMHAWNLFHTCIVDSCMHSFMHMEFAGENAGEKRKRKSKSRRRRKKRTTVPSCSNDREEESEHRFLIIYSTIYNHCCWCHISMAKGIDLATPRRYDLGQEFDRAILDALLEGFDTGAQA